MNDHHAPELIRGIMVNRSRPPATRYGLPEVRQSKFAAAEKRPNPRDVFDSFVAALRAGGIQYSAVGATNCEALAIRLKAAFDRAGLAGAATEKLIGTERYVIAAPDFIDRAWNGAAVMSGGAQVGGIVSFENHTAVKLGGVIFDPTCGYVGAEAGWYCAFETIDEIDGTEIPCDKAAEDQPGYWRAQGPLTLSKPFARLSYSADGAGLTLMTKAEVMAKL
jgi:hypothetical protein